MKAAAAIAVAIVVLILIMFSVMGFVGHQVKPNEIGYIIHKGKLVEVVGPGMYTKWGLFWDIVDVRTEGIKGCAFDPEVLTSDQQRIGIEVCATVHRPGMSTSFETHQKVFSTYKTLLTSDEALVGKKDGEGKLVLEGLMQELAKQGMKSCVGDRTFDEAAVGASRDELRLCLDERTSALGEEYSIEFKNLTVPNIVIHPSVQQKLDLITQEKFETDLQHQQALRIAAEAQAELARQTGEIKVEQGRNQEEQRQRAITAELEKQAIESEAVVIQAEKNNEILEAELKLTLEEKNLEIQRLRALALLADEAALAQLYQDHPEYVNYLIQIAFAESWGDTDKVFLSEGQTPEMIISPSGEVDIVVEPGN